MSLREIDKMQGFSPWLETGAIVRVASNPIIGDNKSNAPDSLRRNQFKLTSRIEFADEGVRNLLDVEIELMEGRNDL